MYKSDKTMKFLKLLGKLLAVFSIFFVVYRLYKMDFSWGTFQNPYQVCLLIFLLSFLSIFDYFINAIAWKKFVDFFSGTKNNTFALVCVYFKSNIQKYLPGNVIQYAGRNLLAKEYGVSQKSVAAASIMEVIWISISAVFFSTVISLKNTRTVIRQLQTDLTIKEDIKFFLIIGIVLLLIGLLILGKSRYRGILWPYLNRKFFVLLGKTGLLYVSNFIVSGILLSLIFGLILHCKIDYASIASTNVLAWLAGYVVPGSPGGIGIREAVLILLLGTKYAKGTVALAAVLLRICGIVGDFLSYLMSLCLEFVVIKRKSRYVS